MSIHESRAHAQAFKIRTHADRERETGRPLCGKCRGSFHAFHEAGECRCAQCEPDRPPLPTGEAIQ